MKLGDTPARCRQPRPAPHGRSRAGAWLWPRTHPALAVEILSGIDPERGILRHWFPYWHFYTSALHQLSEFSQEVEAGRRAERLHPDYLSPFIYQGRAWAGLGQVDKVEEILDRLLASGRRRRDSGPGSDL